MRFAIILSAWFALSVSAFAQTDSARQFADGLYARGYHEMAAREYRELLAKEPSRGDADVILYRLAECLIKGKDMAGASEACGKLTASHPKSPYANKARLRRAEILMEQESFDEALVLLGELLASSPEDEIEAGALYHQGMLLRDSGQPAKAESSFSKVVDQHKKSPYASFAALELAAIYRADRPADAEELYQQMTADNSSPRLAAEAAFQQAVLAFERKRFRDSAAAFDRLLKNWPDDQRAAEAPLRAAWAMFYAEDYTACAELAAKHGKKTSDEWLYLQAASARRLGREDEAKPLYAALIADHPDSVWRAAAIYEQALILFNGKDFKKAADMLEPVLKDSSVSEAAHLLMIEACVSGGNDERALKACADFAELFSRSKELPAVLYRRADILLKRDACPEASDILARIVRDHPESDVACAAQFNLAFCEEKAARWEAALEGWRAVRSQCKDAALVEQASFREALVEMQLGNDKPAIGTLEKFIRDFPQSKDVHDAAWRLGMLLTRSGKAEDAQKVYRAALDRKPPEEWRDKLRIPLAALLQQTGRDDEAAAMFQPLPGKKAMGDMPPALMHWLASRLLNAQSFADAQTVALALAKRKDAAAWAQGGWYLAGKASSGLGKKDEAREAFKKAAETDGDARTSADAALQWGLLALDAGAADEASGAFTLAAERSPGDDLLEIRARSYYGLGRVAESKDDCDEASRYYLSVGLLFDEPALVPECLWRAAECLGKLQRNDERNLTLKELRERYPESEWAKKEQL
ncbi:MAG: tetratricopeptide repeat protein [Kiritimatiellia bacterium]